jgi:hypothetical protein
MNIEFAFLTRAADLSSDGTLSVLGADLDLLQAPAFPFLLPSFSVVVKFLLGADETKVDSTLRVSIVGEGIGSLAPELNTRLLHPSENMAKAKKRAGLTLVGTFQGTTFPNPGQYAVHLIIDGVLQKELPLWLEQIPNAGS